MRQCPFVDSGLLPMTNKTTKGSSNKKEKLKKSIPFTLPRRTRIHADGNSDHNDIDEC